MKRLVSFSLAVVTFLFVLVATDRRAFAYVDPGTGMIALQSIASIAAAGSYFMRRKIMGLFGKGEQKPVAKVYVAAPAAAAKASREAA